MPNESSGNRVGPYIRGTAHKRGKRGSFMRESFIFYRSFFESIQALPKGEKLKTFEAIANYALNEVETELTGTAKIIYSMAKPYLAANTKRYQNGCRGGRPKETDEPRKEIEGIELTNITESQYQKLCDKYGEAVVDKAIELFETWLGKGSKTAKQYIGSNHYMHFRNDSWVISQAKELVLGTQPNWGGI